MERLNRSERNKIFNLMKTREDELEALLESRKLDIAYCATEVKEYELLMRKYRMMYCYLLLRSWNLIDSAENFPLIDTKDIFYNYHRGKIGNEGYTQEYAYEMTEWARECAEIYFSYCLKNTDWKIHYIHDIQDYEQFDDDTLKSMQNIIETHWFYMINANECYEEEYYGIESKYLEDLGFEPNDNTELIPYVNLVLTNHKLKEMLKICNLNNILIIIFYFKNSFLNC